MSVEDNENRYNYTVKDGGPYTELRPRAKWSKAGILFTDGRALCEGSLHYHSRRVRQKGQPMRKLIGLACSMACIAVLASGCAKKAAVDGTYLADIDVGSSVTVSEVGMANPDVILPVSLELAGGEYKIIFDTDAMARDFEDARVDDDHVIASVEAEDEGVYTGHYTIEDAAIIFDGDLSFTGTIDNDSITADHFLGFDEVVFAR